MFFIQMEVLLEERRHFPPGFAQAQVVWKKNAGGSVSQRC